uniref:Glutamyl-tRNA(Gln) amidotransferase subunit A, mitochondrial n=1 Tax=Phallusia mammillata TaxID=59560 RepID=A0A6F9DR15_9ASCI|nr:glutamyl-tRNA(Gln) amidotransferase subunit A, mitochondrial-like [Phallusia mammillata]
MVSNIVNRTAVEVLKLLQEGTVSLPEVYAACTKRMQQVKDLNAFITTTNHEKGQDISQGSLAGLPFGVKDNYCTKGEKTTCASNMLKQFVPSYNATVVEKLCAAGGTIMGKTNMDEFAMGSGSVDSAFGAVKSPWKYDFGKSEDENDWYITGGSSGGSAVAVATGSCFFALGSDTGGSVRSPAALCGTVGLKPTYGALSRHGLISLANAMDTPGIFTRSVDDAALFFNIMSGHDPLDSTSAQHTTPNVKLAEVEKVKDLVIGIPKEYHGPQLSPEILDAWDWMAGKFSDAGAKVVSVSLPNTMHSIQCYYILSSGDVASNMARYDGIEFGHRGSGSSFSEMLADGRTAGFGNTVKQRILAGNYFLLKQNYTKYYEQALKIRRLIVNDFRAVFAGNSTGGSGVDLLLTPVSISTAARYSDFIQANNRSRCAEHDIYTQPANMSGVPGISVPIKISKEGLPVSLQLMADNFNEQTLLRAAKFIEQEVAFPGLQLDFTS